MIGRRLLDRDIRRVSKARLYAVTNDASGAQDGHLSLPFIQDTARSIAE